VRRHLARDPILDLEDIGRAQIEVVGPERCAVADAQQVDADAEPIAGTLPSSTTSVLNWRAAVNASRSSAMYRWIALVGRTIIPPVWLILRITASAMPSPR